MTASLPELDLRRFRGSPADRAGFLDDLRRAARDVGFFYLAGHGVEKGTTDAVLRLARQFFSLPAADKSAISMERSRHFRGYNLAGGELTRGRRDWREQLDVGAEEEAAPLVAGAPAWTRLRGPNQWPVALPELKPAILKYQDAVTVLGIEVLRAFAASLDQPEDVFDPIYTPAPNKLLKLIRYPERASDADTQGVGAHKDSGFVTILLQDAVAGLQVEAGDGWIDAPPRPGTFVVNIGEILELASEGYLRANVHRVVSPPRGVDRLSVAFFLGARLDATVPALDIPPALAADSRGVTRDPANPLFHEYGRNFLKSRLRSHPDVARRHHPDLVTATQGEPAAAY